MSAPVTSTAQKNQYSMLNICFVPLHLSTQLYDTASAPMWHVLRCNFNHDQTCMMNERLQEGSKRRPIKNTNIRLTVLLVVHLVQME